MVAMIRTYRDSDAPFLARIHSAIFLNDPLSASGFDDLVDGALRHGGRVWTIAADEPFGCALAVPVPGLPHIAELSGFVAPARQRQGHGSALLQRVLADLRATAVRQLSYMTADPDGPGACFLRGRHFYPEHEEWVMVRDLANLPEQTPYEGVRLISLPRQQAIDQLRRLYAASFSSLPWDQPYSTGELHSALHDAADIRFLDVAGTLIGFAWLQFDDDGAGVIEPLGILPAYQHQGYGRCLLVSALHELAARGVTRAQIGAWSSNQAAVQLYQSLGFEHRQTFVFLAYDLD